MQFILKVQKDIQITNNTIDQVSNGPGIYLKDASNILINNNNIQYSKNGILIENSNKITITDNNIENNKNSGIYVGENNKNINIMNNNIVGNNWKGIVVNSANNVNIISNVIMANRDNSVQARANNGAGIYVDCTVDSLKINGNYIFENGNYGVFDTYKTKKVLKTITKHKKLTSIFLLVIKQEEYLHSKMKVVTLESFMLEAMYIHLNSFVQVHTMNLEY